MSIWDDKEVEFETLKGKIITKIDGDKNSEELIFHCDNGESYKMYHYQDCCESVNIEDITGDLDDLLNSEILLAEEVVSDENPPEIQAKIDKEKQEQKEKEGEDYYDWGEDSFTWTFYKLSTIKGSVTIRWYGTSNGYYSEAVNLYLIDGNKENN